jgi:hypothetical protein
LIFSTLPRYTINHIRGRGGKTNRMAL